MTETVHIDNLVIGAGLVGSITAWILANQGYSGLLLERSPDAGGVNGSFLDSLGNRFDYGRHIISQDRSDFSTNFFKKVLGDRIHSFSLERALVLRGQIVPYAADLSQWPKAVAELVQLDANAPPVRLGSTRAEFAQAYGQQFADLAFDDMLSAYPTLVWQREHGIPEEQLMRWLFPWFFPRSALEAAPEAGTEQGIYSQEARDYHFSKRHAEAHSERILYPREGGFAYWIEQMLEQASDLMTPHIGVGNIDFDFDKDSLVLRSATTQGTTYIAKRIFWCVPLPVLCIALGWQLPKGHPQWEMLGSFAFAKPIGSAYHEILFADPQYPVRRVNFAGKIAGQEPSHTLQVEFTTPQGDFDLEADEWQRRWTECLYATGIVPRENPVTSFDFRKVSRGIVTTEDLSGFVTECREKLASSQTNLITPHLAAAADNNSRLVPEVFKRVYGALFET